MLHANGETEADKGKARDGVEDGGEAVESGERRVGLLHLLGGLGVSISFISFHDTGRAALTLALPSARSAR